jgi:hypothetical protein
VVAIARGVGTKVACVREGIKIPVAIAALSISGYSLRVGSGTASEGPS